MTTLALKPRLRWPLQVSRHPHPLEQGKEVLVLQCSLRIAKPLMLIREAGALLPLFDGERSLDEILDLAGPAGVTRQHLDELVTLLDDALLLDNDRFQEAHARMREEYATLSVREPSLAGAAYPREPEALTRQLNHYLDASSPIAAEQNLEVLVTPHIDYRRGFRCYGKTFPVLRARPLDVIVLMGTCHQPATGLFHLSTKKFLSPLGVSENASEFTRTLAAKHGERRSFGEELVHRYEHSLELQLPFLQLLAPRAHIVPVLVGGFHSFLQRDRYPEADEEFSSFTEALASTLTEWRRAGSKVLLLAGVDMSHVGREFGDQFLLTETVMAEIGRRDSAYLDAIGTRDRHRLFEHIRSDHDARRVCGFPTLYTVMDLLNRCSVEYQSTLIDYQQAVDPEGLCGVTFAGMTLTSQRGYRQVSHNLESL